MNKQTLRNQLIDQRKRVPPDVAAAAASALTAQVMAALPPAPCVIAAYVGTQGEIDPLPTLMTAHEAGYTLALPVVMSGSRELQFRAWQPGGALVSGAYHIAHPPDTAAIVAPDTLLVPLVAFDADNHRLGYGAGYYDATLTALKQANPACQAIGLAYDFQKVERLPAEAHDVRLDAVVSG